jgi:FKBP-type peptidyl-prolyl cis-trans isomerase SlyD
MNTSQNPMSVGDDVVVSMDYTLTVNGEIVDTSLGREPLMFIQGSGHIIPGLERELYNMAKGENKQVSVAAKDGYGEEDPDAYMDVPRDEFPEEIPAKKGTQIQMRDQDGETFTGFIDEINDEIIRLNLNHPMAGKQLNFSVTVVDLRFATKEELEHGHVH